MSCDLHSSEFIKQTSNSEYYKNIFACDVLQTSPQNENDEATVIYIDNQSFIDRGLTAKAAVYDIFHISWTALKYLVYFIGSITEH